MARQNLSGLTPEEVKAHKNEQARLRMEKMRGQRKKDREMAKKSAMLTPTSPEVVEFVDEIEGLPLSAKVELVAHWQREQKQQLPVEPFLGPISGETSEDYWSRKNKARDLGLAKMLAVDHFASEKAAVRKKRFNEVEAADAAKLGITVYELQQRKKTAAWKAKKEATQKAREVERLVRREAA